MSSKFLRHLKKVKHSFNNLKTNLVFRVWNLAKRLDPKQIKRGKRKKHFSKLGNK